MGYETEVSRETTEYLGGKVKHCKRTVKLSKSSTPAMDMVLRSGEFGSLLEIYFNCDNSDKDTVKKYLTAVFEEL